MSALFCLIFQTASLEAAARDFAAGGELPREELRRAGPAAIRPLRAARALSPRRCDELLLELKLGCASGPAGPDLAARLHEGRSLELADVAFREAFVGLAEDLPLLYDPAFHDEVLGRRVCVLRENAPTWEVLEAVAEAAGIDWGIYYGRVLFAAPERLWPAGPPPAAPELTPGARAEALDWLAELGAPAPERREAAQARLEDLGESAAPLLEEESRRGGDPERTARCREILARLRGRRERLGVFGPAVYERQGTLEARRALEETLLTVRLSYQPVDAFLAQLFASPAGLPHEFRGGPLPGRVFTDFVRVPAGAALSLLAHAWGLELWMEEGRLVVGSPEAAARHVAALR
jgi:hypothetical protein